MIHTDHVIQEETPMKQFGQGCWSIVHYTAVALGMAYAAGLISLWLYRTFTTSFPPFLAFLNLFFPFLFVPTLVVWLVAPILRSRWIWGTAVLLTLFFGVDNGWRWFPNPTPDPTAPTLTVMTFNMAMRDCNCSRLNEMAGFITVESPDLVFLQEVSEPMAVILGQFSDYPYQELQMPVQTTAILSKYPIVASEWHSTAGERDYLTATIAWQGELVQVFAVHPYPPGLIWDRWTSLPIGVDETAVQAQVRRIAQHAATFEHALIVGDFNMSDQSPAYHELTTQFEDAFVGGGQGWGRTFPLDVRIPPLVRLDYVFHSSHFQATHVYEGCGTISDHCYVVAQLALKQ